MFYSGKRNRVPRRVDKTVRFYSGKRNRVPRRVDKIVHFIHTRGTRFLGVWIGVSGEESLLWGFVGGGWILFIG